MNDYSSLLYSEKSVLATDCYDLTPLTYEERGMLSQKTPQKTGFLKKPVLSKKTGASAFRHPSAVTEFNSVSKLTHYW
ncbi:MAG UNVERIFIED_CONTAM: hypothetical protein LVR29_29670 [Microcystis novacekii LVE1205-3]